MPLVACDGQENSMGYGALVAVETSKAKANNETLEYGRYATSPLRTRRYPSENV
jgi:hypothetical protein